MKILVLNAGSSSFKYKLFDLDNDLVMALGLVEKIGEGVKRVKAGDHVLVTLIRSCGKCHYCSQGDKVQCDSVFPLDENSPLRTSEGEFIKHGLRTAAFAESVVVDSSQLVSIPKEISLESASVLSCGVITGFGAVVNTAKIFTENELNKIVSTQPKLLISEDKILKARKDGSSLGAIIEIRCSGIPAGLGEPIYEKLDADLAKAMVSINAVKGVEIGNGFESVQLPGESNVDEIRIKNKKPYFLSNNSGGILGGISTGQDIVIRFCVKPTSSILTSRKTIDVNFKEKNITTKGRHDPCVGIRAVPVGEAMVATTIADHCLRFL